LILVAVSAGGARAQPSEAELKSSHNLKALELPSGDLDLGWIERLQKQRIALSLPEQVKGLKPEDLDGLKQNHKKLIELLKQQGIKPELLDAIKNKPELLDAAIDGVKKGEGFPPPNQESTAPPEVALPRKNQDLRNDEPPPPQEQRIPYTPPPRSEQQNAPPETTKPPEASEQPGQQDGRLTPSPSGDQETPRLQYGEKLQNLAERLAMNPQFRNSEAMQKAMQSLAKSIGQEDPKWRKLAEASDRFRDRLGDLGSKAKLDRLWSPENLKLPAALSLDRLPDFTSRFLPGKEAGNIVPNVGLPSSPPNSTLSTLAWIVGLIVGAVCLRQLWLRAEETKRENQRKQALKRAWPIDPNAIKNRDDLIRAYEHLALANFGLNARTWNHLVIAAELGQSASAVRRNAVLSLADAYERARYSPTEETMSSETLAEARQNLLVLAGASGS
jgi:hypothetical protein